MADYTCPNFLGESEKNLVWITIRAYSNRERKVFSRKYDEKPFGSSIKTWKFLAPMEIQENVGHTYEAYQSMYSRASEVYEKIYKSLYKMGSIRENLKNGTIDNWLKNGFIYQTMNTTVPFEKFDASSIYVNSKRREYNFSFQLVAKDDPFKEVVEPIKELEKYSCASYNDSDTIKFTPPYVFEVTTTPNRFLYIKHANIISIQPTYKAPYVDGYPSIAELQVNFEDLDPLYQRTVDNDTNPSGKVNATVKRG